MSASPETRRSLLVRVRDPGDDEAWREFVRVYAPLIHGFAARRGLQDADAADVAQQVLLAIALALPSFEYDASKSNFRGWLFTITRNFVFKYLARQSRAPAATGDTKFNVSLLQHPDERDEEARWNREHEMCLFHWAVEKVRNDFCERTWDAFWAVSVEGKPAAVVAQELGISVGAVYFAKSRVTAEIRKRIESIAEP